MLRGEVTGMALELVTETVAEITIHSACRGILRTRVRKDTCLRKVVRAAVVAVAVAPVAEREA